MAVLFRWHVCASFLYTTLNFMGVVCLPESFSHLCLRPLVCCDTACPSFHLYGITLPGASLCSRGTIISPLNTFFLFKDLHTYHSLCQKSSFSSSPHPPKHRQRLTPTLLLHWAQCYFLKKAFLTPLASLILPPVHSHSTPHISLLH